MSVKRNVIVPLGALDMAAPVVTKEKKKD